MERGQCTVKVTTTDRPKRYALFATGVLVDSDELRAGDYLATSLEVVAEADENDYLAALAPHADAFPPLPDSGWLEAGSIYQWGDGAVIVRQSHNRTEHAPEDAPALFIVYREDAAGVLEWVAGEQVAVGTRRVYEGVEYECLQSHVTQGDWTPNATPALWRVVAEEPATGEWAVGVSYAVGDVVTYAGVEYRCRQAHTSISTWTPPVVLALWEPLP